MRLKFFIAALAMVILSGCSQARNTPVNPEYKSKGRFDILDKFETFDDGVTYSYLLKDRETTKCYLFLSLTTRSAGMVEAPCKK